MMQLHFAIFFPNPFLMEILQIYWIWFNVIYYITSLVLVQLFQLKMYKQTGWLIDKIMLHNSLEEKFRVFLQNPKILGKFTLARRVAPYR